MAAERYTRETRNVNSETYSQEPKTVVRTNTIGPSETQGCIDDADPMIRGGITSFPMKPDSAKGSRA